MQTNTIATYQNDNNNITQKIKISGRDDLITSFGLGHFYDTNASPYMVPIGSKDRQIPELPSLYDKYISNIPGQIRYESNHLVRSLVFSEPKNKFENLPSLSRQAIANAFRIKPGPVEGIDTTLLAWPKKQPTKAPTEKESELKLLKRNKPHEKDCSTDYLYDELHINKKQRVGLESATVLVD